MTRFTMTPFIRSLCTLALTFTVAWAGIARGQDSPLPSRGGSAARRAGADRLRALRAAAPPAVAPAAAPAPAASVVGGRRGGAVPPPPPEPPRGSNDPVVQALLESKPSTPHDLLRATIILVDLGYPDLAQPLMKQLADAKIDDATMAALVTEFGSGNLLRLAQIKELGASAVAFSQAAQTAALRYRRDPARLAVLVTQLSNADPVVAHDAVVELSLAHEAGAVALIRVLADPARAAEHRKVQQALVELGSDAVEPLLATIRAPDHRLAAMAIEVLGESANLDATYFLLAPALSPSSPAEVRAAAQQSLNQLLGGLPSRSDAAAKLYNRSRVMLAGQKTLPTDATGAAAVWRWDDKVGGPRVVSVPYDAALASAAAELVRGARQIMPNSPQLDEQYYLSALEADSRLRDPTSRVLAGPGTPHDELTGQGLASAERVLAFALAEHRTGAAVSAIETIADLNDRSALHAPAVEPSVLVQAAQSEDPRVRFAAVTAVMQLRPIEPYSGSSFVVEAIGHMLTGVGTPRVVVGDRRPVEADRMAGLLRALGYEVDTATDARALVQAAIHSADNEIILIDMTMASPTSGEVLQSLRRDARTKQVPIGIVASTGDLDKAGTLARRLKLVEAIVRPRDTFGTKFETDKLTLMLGAKLVGASERESHAHQALLWVAQIADQSQHVYDLERAEPMLLAALTSPRLAVNAAVVAGKFNSSAAQLALVEIASRSVLPLATREAALSGLQESISRFGTRITAAEIALQYDRYNASETLDKDTQTILAGILDAIEARAAADAPPQLSATTERRNPATAQ